MDYRSFDLTYWYNGQFLSTSDNFITEAYLTLEIKNAGRVTILRTPGNEIAHAAGFVLSAGFIQIPEEILSAQFSEKNPDYISLTLAKPCQAKAISLLSDPDTAKTIVNTLSPLPLSTFIPVTKALSCLESHLHAERPLRQKTYAAHCSSLYDLSYTSLYFAEDVGRHNALDKAIGFLFLQKKLSEAQILTLSSRISLELVQKAAFARIPIVLAKARPTSAAILLAQRLQITLACLDQNNGLFVFSAPERLLP